MSLEEWKLRDELEEEVENDLEKEIKDGIFQLAKKLHNLYMHQMERNKTKISKSKSRKTAFSEVNITIKMEGETKIEIKEIKKEGSKRALKKVQLDSITPVLYPSPKLVRGNKSQHFPSTRRPKFDWTKSLRSGSDNSSFGSRIDGKKRKDLGDKNGGKTTALLEMGWKW